MFEACKQVESVSGITPATLDEATIYRTQPLILKGLCDEWPIVHAGLSSDSAGAAYLRDNYSGEPVVGSLGQADTKGRVFYNSDMTGFNFTNSKVNLNLVLDQLLANSDSSDAPLMYMGSTDARRFFPSLIQDNSLTIPQANPIISVWLGNQSRIAAHYDFPVNLACNVVGKRRFTLFPPDQIKHLYPGPIEFAPGGQEISMVDFSAPDLEKFPLFSKAIESALVAELAPGDCLLIPSMWWHHVEALTSFNVLITHWWRDTPGYLGRPNNALTAAILALRSLPKEQRAAWKEIFNYYIFDDQLASHDYIDDNALGILEEPLSEDMARRLRADLLNKLKR